MRQLGEVVGILKNAGYLDVGLNQAVVNKIKFLPLGSILLEKIRAECQSSKGGINTYLMNSPNETNTIDFDRHRQDSTMILRTKEFRESFMHVKNHFQADLPLAIKTDLIFKKKSSALSSDSFSVDLARGTVLTCSYFVNESAATEHFHKIQRERKIWWMKFSLNPGRYFLSDLTTDELNGCKMQSVRIKSKFNFGEMELETVNVTPMRGLQLDDPSDFCLKDVRLRRDIMPAVIRSELCLETAVLGILLDSIEDTRDEKISINRKIAPYQCNIFCFSKELEDLATHVADVIRRSGLTTLNLQKCRANEEDRFDRELREMDRIGIPYSIILDADSLSTGVMKLRCRDTGLSEIIHITDVPDYLIKIFNA